MTLARHRPTVHLSRIRRPDDIVLASMPLREDADRSVLSRFAEDVWSMDAAIFRVTVRLYRTISFESILCPVEKLTAKEYIYAWLNERFPDRSERLSPSTARVAMVGLCQFMAFVCDRIGTFDVSAIDQDLLDEWRHLHMSRKIAPRRLADLLKPVSQLNRLAPFLTHGGISFSPWKGRSIFAVAGCDGRRQENITPRIPEPVIGAILRWSLKYVDVFARDIFAARAELDALYEQYENRPRGGKAGSIVEKTTAWIAKRRKSGRGIPVWSEAGAMGGICGSSVKYGRVRGDVLNMALIGLQSGFNITNLIGHKVAYPLLMDAVAELGTELGGMDTEISFDPETGKPWRSRFDSFALIREEKHLQTAAYILCAYLTGMRGGEVQAMQHNCLVRDRSVDGMVERIAVRSTVYKGRPAPGETAEWITIEPVARAIQVAERLASRHLKEGNEDRLWGVLHRGTVPEHGLPHILRQIARFQQHLDDRYNVEGEPAIPWIEGRPWSFNTLQLRRTVAWYIANRPFGVIAGKIQYKHASVAMFDGYAGSSASGFRQEVEQEHLLGQLDDVVEHYEACRRGERPAGPAGIRVAAEMDRVVMEMGPLPGVIADRARIRSMLGHLARTLHVGHLSDCFFEPATALCLRHSADAEKGTPSLSNCAPDRCPNSCIARRHLPAWQSAITQAESMLEEKRLSDVQRTAIRQDRDRMRKLIAPLLEDRL